MYSPRIYDGLIPEIYRAAKSRGIAMTTWVNQVLAQALSQQAQSISEQEEQPKQNSVTRLCSQRLKKEENLL